MSENYVVNNGLKENEIDLLKLFNKLFTLKNIIFIIIACVLFGGSSYKFIPALLSFFAAVTAAAVLLPSGSHADSIS